MAPLQEHKTRRAFILLHYTNIDIVFLNPSAFNKDEKALGP